MIPPWVHQLIHARDIETFDKIFLTTLHEIEKTFALFGKAECLRLGGADFSPDIAQAYALYIQLDNNQTSLELRYWVFYGKAECLRIGGSDFPANVLKACQLYQILDNDHVPTNLRRLAVYSKAVCFKEGGSNFPADIQKAYELFIKLLEINDLPENLRDSTTKQKKSCEEKIRLRTKIDASSNMSIVIDELAKMRDIINKLIEDNTKINTELVSARLTQKALLVDNSQLQIMNSRLKGDLVVANLQISTLADERSYVMKELAAEKDKNKQFAEEQVFKFNQAQCTIYQLATENDNLRKELAKHQLPVLPNQSLSNDVAAPLAPTPPPPVSQTVSATREPLIPIAIKVGLPPIPTNKRRMPEQFMASPPLTDRLSEVISANSLNNGLTMFSSHESRSEPRGIQHPQVAAKQLTPGLEVKQNTKP